MATTDRLNPLAVAVRRAMARRGVGINDTAKAIGIPRQSLWNVRAGRYRPAAELLARLADQLDAPEILETVTPRPCSECHRNFVRGARSPSSQKFCSDSCRTKHHSRLARERRNVDRKNLLIQATQRNNALTDRVIDLTQELEATLTDIARFCRSCSGAICRTPDCEMRARSPLPLAAERVA
jgi:transcriptional regulator with XRE-family HTH domain